MEAGIDGLDVATSLFAVPGRGPVWCLRGLAVPGRAPTRRRVQLRVIPGHGPGRRVRVPAVSAPRPRLPECHRESWLSHESTLCHAPISFALEPRTSIPA